MAQNYVTLRDFIDMLSGQTNAHICIHDVSGILKSDVLKLDFKYQMHSRDFCSAAKRSPKGYRLCISCKILANSKAIAEKTLFYGFCPYGLFEVVKPVIIDGKTQCIIYIGNLVFNLDQLSEKIRSTSKITKAPKEELLTLMKDTQTISSPDPYIMLANLIDSYLRLLYEQYKSKGPGTDEQQYHWAVLTLLNYCSSNYNQNITLQSLAKLYFIDAKYIGRLFKKQVGFSFHEYLNRIRLNTAVGLLQNTQKNIIDIAMQCGFQNVTYFNRIFFKQYNMTPTKYRDALNNE